MRFRRVFFLVVLDIAIISISFFVSLYFKFDTFNNPEYLAYYRTYIIPVTILKIGIFYLFNFYKILWEYASIDELIEIIIGVVLANISAFVLTDVIGGSAVFTNSGIITMLDLILIGGLRFTYRAFKRYNLNIKVYLGKKNILIIGAGAAGVMILKELRTHKSIDSKPVGFIDDDIEKIGKFINGVKVLGNRKDIPKVVEKLKVDEIIIALPSASTVDRVELLNICKNTSVKTKTLPGIYELIGEEITINKVRDVQLEDLLGRNEIQLDLKELEFLIKDKSVLISGGAGSIGSELARQIIKYNPKKIIILDIYENSLYDFENELRTNYPKLDFIALIISIRDTIDLDRVFEKYKPDLVFHAAAHKHVPLMESSPEQAVKNNVFGTLNIIRSADKHNVDRFVLISTDKAVNPTNVMGATKRVAEKLIQIYNGRSKTDYVAVRFGNVLGSNGSVIPLFKKQIENGGPVTVTDPDVVRFFMTIPEACQLVLQAGAMANGGEIFVLDMGEPIKILDLALDLIKLSGFEPYENMPIEFIGLRPGEKLYEELLMATPDLKNTKHDKIFIEEMEHPDYDDIMQKLNSLKESLDRDNPMDIKLELVNLVEGYKPFHG